MLQCLSLITHNLYQTRPSYVSITVMLCTLLVVGLARVNVNLLPYGVDQLPIEPLRMNSAPGSH